MSLVDRLKRLKDNKEILVDTMCYTVCGAFTGLAAINMIYHYQQPYTVNFWKHNEGYIEWPIFVYTTYWASKKISGLMKKASEVEE